MILLSVIIPVYNIEEYIGECLSSLSGQQFDNIEFIIIDDGSNDSSGQICDNWAAKDSRFQIHHIENSGVSQARNKGICSAKGEWIWFIDGDDWINPDAIPFIVSILKKASDIDMIAFGYYDGFGKGQLIPRSKLIKYGAQTKVNAIQNILIEGGYFTSVWNKIFRRSIIVENEIWFNSAFCVGEDERFLFSAMYACRKFIFIPNVLYNYRYRSNSALNLNPLSTYRIHSLLLKRVIADELIKISKKNYRTALSRLYNRSYELRVLAYRNNDMETGKFIKKALHGSFFYWLFARDITIKRKVKIIFMSLKMRIKIFKFIF